MSDTLCEHGRLRRKCADCDLTEAEKRIAELEAALKAAHEDARDELRLADGIRVEQKERIAELEAALAAIMECSGDPETYQIAKRVLGPHTRNVVEEAIAAERGGA